MSPIRFPAIAVPLLLLGACGQPAADDAAPTAPATPALPAFALATDDAVKGIAALGAPWSGATPSDPMLDSKTGGKVTVLTAADGTAQVFSRPEGKVWQMRVTIGTPSNCRGSGPLIAALPKVVALASPGTTLDASERLALGNGLTDLKPTTREIGGARITVVGGCTHWLTVAVPEAT